MSKVNRRVSVPCYGYEHAIDPKLVEQLRPRVVSLNPYESRAQIPRVLQYDYDDICDGQELEGSPTPSKKRESKMSKRQSKHVTENDVVRYDRATLKQSFEPITPLQGRSCTDVICLLLFVAFLVGWGFIATYAFTEGNLSQVLTPTDSKGLKCGVDALVKNRPKVLFFDLSECFLNPLTPISGCQTPHICVEQCPQEIFVLALNPTMPIDILRKKMVCIDGFNKDHITNYKDAEKFTNGEHPECAKYYLPSTDIQSRCIPVMKPEFLSQIIGDIKSVQSNDSLSEMEEALGKTNVGVLIVGDIRKSWGRILIGLAAAMLACFIFIFMMRWLAGPVVWLSILGAIGSLGFATYYSYMRYTKLKDQVNHQSRSINIPSNIKALLSQTLESEEIWFWILVVSAVVFTIILLIIVFIRKRICIAVAIIKEGSKAVSSVKTAVFFPLLPMVGKAIIIIFGIIVALQLESIGTKDFRIDGLDSNCTCTRDAVTYVNDGPCDPKIFYRDCRTKEEDRCPDARCHFMGYDIPNLTFYVKAYNAVGFLWVFFFITAFGEMVLGATFATWYWTFKKSNVPYFTVISGIGRTCRYHLGTIAFGSLIITICQIAKMMLEYINQKLKKHDNEVTRAIMCIFKCLFWCFEKFLKFLNKNAYIMCAIHGKNFCRSARDAFSLILRNCVRALAVDKVTDFLFFLSKIFLTVGMSYLTYLYFTFDTEINEKVSGILKIDESDQVQFKEVPMILVGIGTYVIATLFFKVYSMAIDTLFLCFLEDCEINDGSAEKPYFMSKELMKIMKKTNKESGYSK